MKKSGRVYPPQVNFLIKVPPKNEFCKSRKVKPGRVPGKAGRHWRGRAGEGTEWGMEEWMSVDGCQVESIQGMTQDERVTFDLI